MSRELKVYNPFDELILHLEFVDGDPTPLQILDGTPLMQGAIHSLIGQNFDFTVFVGKQHLRFQAGWGTPEYIDALAGYWRCNFGWRTKIIEKDLVLSQSARSVGFSGDVADRLIHRFNLLSIPLDPPSELSRAQVEVEAISSGEGFELSRGDRPNFYVLTSVGPYKRSISGNAWGSQVGHELIVRLTENNPTVRASNAEVVSAG